MGKIFLIMVFTFQVLLASQEELIKVDNSFITKYEYGKMLYNNPRGIGCNSCHGNDANGKRIVSFKHEYNKKVHDCELVIPNIKDVDYDTFVNKINSKKNKKKKFDKKEVCEKLIYYSSVMPTYFLVDEEIKAIYYYIKNLKE